MRTVLGLCVALCLLVPVSTRAADQSSGAPVIRHVPETTAVRGVPVNLVCTIEASAVLTQTVCLVRITDAGPTTEFPLKGNGDGGYEALIPVSMVEGVHVFWYSLTAYDANGRVTSTVWMRVRIVEGAAGTPTWWKKPIVWIGSGALLAVATVVLITNDDDDNALPPPPPPPPPPPAGRKDEDQGGSGGSPPPPPPLAPTPTSNDQPPCVLTGNEFVDFFNLDYFDTTPIAILICDTCPDANVTVSTTWGAFLSEPVFNSPCNRRASGELQLPKPVFPEPPLPESYSIVVKSNGSVIGSILWPPATITD